MLEIEAIAKELPDAAGGDDHAGRVRELEDVEGEEEGLAEGGYEAVVRWGGERQEVDAWGRGCADERATGGGG